jgi:hypothetical protein
VDEDDGAFGALALRECDPLAVHRDLLLVQCLLPSAVSAARFSRTAALGLGVRGRSADEARTRIALWIGKTTVRSG